MATEESPPALEQASGAECVCRALSLRATIVRDLRAAVDERFVSPRRVIPTALAKAIVNPRVRAVIWHRIAHALSHRRGLLVVGYLIRAHVLKVAGAEIHPQAQLGPGFAIAHSSGLVIGRGVRMGEECLVHQGVTLGEPGRGGRADRWGEPVFGDYVTIGAHAVVVGKIRVGDSVTIGANAVVTEDVPSGAVVGGIPAKVLRTSGQAASF